MATGVANKQFGNVVLPKATFEPCDFAIGLQVDLCMEKQFILPCLVLDAKGKRAGFGGAGLFAFPSIGDVSKRRLPLSCHVGYYFDRSLWFGAI